MHVPLHLTENALTSPVAIWDILCGPGFKVHRKCFYIFGKVRSSTLRIRWVTSCHY